MTTIINPAKQQNMVVPWKRRNIGKLFVRSQLDCLDQGHLPTDLEIVKGAFIIKKLGVSKWVCRKVGRSPWKEKPIGFGQDMCLPQLR